MTISLLLFDEGNRVAPAVLKALTRRFDLHHASSLDGLSGAFNVAVVGPGVHDATEACRRIRQSGLAALVVVLSVDASLKDALGALRARATDFVPNGNDPESVIERVSACVEDREVTREASRACGPYRGARLPAPS